jgi:hypothetical protein
VEHKFGSLGDKILHLNARLILRDNDQTQRIFLAIADITDLEYNRRGLEQLVEKHNQKTAADDREGAYPSGTGTDKMENKR